MTAKSHNVLVIRCDLNIHNGKPCDPYVVLLNTLCKIVRLVKQGKHLVNSLYKLTVVVISIAVTVKVDIYRCVKQDVYVLSDIFPALAVIALKKVAHMVIVLILAHKGIHVQLGEQVCL